MKSKKVSLILLVTILLVITEISVAAASVTFNVSANPLWTDTGVKITKGQVIYITASGTWNTGVGTCDPNGDNSNYYYDLFLNHTAPCKHGEFIAFVGSKNTDPYQGQWGNGSFFPQPTGAGYWAIGNNTTFTADRDGELWFGINDAAVSKVVSDNTGSLTAVVSILDQTGVYLCLSNQAPSSKDRGSSMTYKLYYGNLASGTAHDVILEDRLDGNVTFVSASDGGVYDSSTGIVRWDIGSVNSTDNSYRTITVNIPSSIPVGTIIVNKANIITSDTEVQYSVNEAQASTTVTGLNLPPNVGVEPNNGGTGAVSVYWQNPITFSYHSEQPVSGVNIKIHVNDGGPDIVGNMTPVTSSTNVKESLMMTTETSSTTGTSDWSFTTTPYPRHGSTTVTYTAISGSPSFSVTPDNIIPSKIRVLMTNTGQVVEVPFKDYVKDVLPNEWIPSWDMNALKDGSMAVKNYAWYCILHPKSQKYIDGGYDVRDDTADQVYIPNSPKRTSKTDQAVDETWYYIVTDDKGILQTQYDSGSSINSPDALYAGRMSQQGTEYWAKQGKDWQWILKYYYNGPIYKNITIRDIGIKVVAFTVYIDPAGYIYDVDTGQRISNASVWLQDPDGSGGWENVPTGKNPPISQPDTNPLTTDHDGMYQWDVLSGYYRVHVEAPGYEPANSVMVSIPPPVTDLHVGLHRINNPNVPLVLPIANFTNDVSSGYVPLTVQFTDQSQNAIEWKWDFGDGTNSAERYPTHIYSKSGNHTVKLTTSNGNGLSSTTSTISVQSVPIYPIANFSSSVIEGNAPLSVQFTDISLNTDNIVWDFGDGNNSTDRNPVHTYFAIGNYTVNMTASNANGSDFDFTTVNVTSTAVQSTLPTALIGSNTTNGAAPLTVQFNDLSTNETLGRTWIFGDGTSSTDPNPIHTFTSAGSYIVNLTASNGNGTNTTSSLITVTSSQPSILKINDFTTKVASGYAPLKTEFVSNVSGSNIIKWKWVFEKSGKDYYSQHAVTAKHTFTKPGVYDITLTVWNAAGQKDTLTKKAYITVLKVNPPRANFVGSPTSGKAPLTVKFTDQSTNNPTSWHWNFGDKTISTLQNPVHKYTKKGTYAVSLTVKNTGGSSLVTKTKYIIVK